MAVWRVGRVVKIRLDNGVIGKCLKRKPSVDDFLCTQLHLFSFLTHNRWKISGKYQ